VTSERIPIGRLPEPRWGPRPPWFFPDLPQRAWLEDSLLIVEKGQQIRQCDLRTAWLIEVAPMTGVGLMPRSGSWLDNLATYFDARDWSCTALRAWQDSGDEPVQVVLEICRRRPDQRWILLSEEDFRLLAQIIRSRSGVPGNDSSNALGALEAFARFQKIRPDGSWDWSFRAGPQAKSRHAD
jgi:hypothetical protein